MKILSTLVKDPLVLGIAAMIMIGYLGTIAFPEHDSYAECMADYRVEKQMAEAACPGCTDYKEVDQYNHKRCTRYGEP